MKTASERKAAERAKKRSAGLRAYEIWAHPQDWPRIRKYIDRLLRRHLK